MTRFIADRPALALGLLWASVAMLVTGLGLAIHAATRRPAPGPTPPPPRPRAVPNPSRPRR